MSEISTCTDLCEHCIYIECGDFICDIDDDDDDDDVTIVDWKPFPCKYPEKKVKIGYENKED